MTINLDTHILVFMLNDQLTSYEKEIILSVSDKLCISSIVLWELAMLQKKNKINFDFSSTKWKKLSEDIKILGIDEKVAIQSTELDFKADPSDHIIASTSIITGIPLLTRDQRILTSKIVPFA